MGYDPVVINKTVEKYIKSVTLMRDEAQVIVVEGCGALTPEDKVNAAGQQYHICETTTQYAFSMADCAAAGIDPSAIIAMDLAIAAWAKQLIDSTKPKPAPPLTPEE